MVNPEAWLSGVSRRDESVVVVVDPLLVDRPVGHYIDIVKEI
jgi:hypothetical protein